MATNFPTTLDNSTTIPVESAATKLTVNHVTAHQNIQDTLEAVEAKIGVDGSAVTTSHDYKLSEVTGGDKVVGKTASQTLTSKTLTAPVITSPKVTVGSDAVGDTHYTSNTDGTLSRRAIGSAGDVYTVAGGVPTWSPPLSVADATYAVKGIRVLDANSTFYAADSGSSTAYVITFSPAVNTYTTGQSFKFKATNTNTSTTPTLNVNALGTKTITNTNGSALMIGAILANGIYEVVYDGTNFQILNPTIYQEFVYVTGTTNWVCPKGVTTVLVDIVAGGGAGGSHPGNDNLSAAGGGGGAGATNVTSNVTALTAYSVAVGAGGVVGVSNGATSSFNGISKAGGTNGGDTTSIGTAGDATAGAGGTGRASGSQIGGTGATGTGGGTGGAGGAISGSMSGGGGGGAGGLGGTGGAGGTGASGSGNPAVSVGCGGGGACNQGVGGAGGAGLVVIKVPLNQLA